MFRAMYRGFKDGYNHANGKPLQYNKLYNVSIVSRNTVQEECAEYKLEQLKSELLMLKTIVERDNKRALLLEHELKTASAKRRETILNKLNTLDKQTYKHKKRMDQIKDLLSD